MKISDIEKFYNDLLVKLSLQVTRQIDLIYNDMINNLATTIHFSKNQSSKNIALHELIIKIKRDLITKVQNATIKNIEKGQALSIVKNEKLLYSYFAGYNADKWIKENINRTLLNVDLKDISKRIWKHNKDYFTQVELLMNAGLTEGKSAKEITQQLRKLSHQPNSMSLAELKELKADKVISEIDYRRIERQIINYHPGQGVYKSARANAYRLARTEINMAYRLQNHAQMSKFDFVIGWEVELSGQHPKVDICDDMIGEYPKDFKFSGWHPACICFATPILAKPADAAKLIQGEKVNVNSIKNIPKSAQTYFKKTKEIINNAKSVPYYLRENHSFLDKYLS